VDVRPASPEENEVFCNTVKDRPLNLDYRLLTFDLKLTKTSITGILDAIESRHPGFEDRRSREILFAGQLHREFEKRVYTLLLAELLSQPDCERVIYCVEQILHFGAKRFPYLNLSNLRPANTHKPIFLDALDTGEFYRFVWRDPEKLSNPSAGFYAGLSFLSQMAIHHRVGDMERLIWSLASIEAMIGKGLRGAKQPIIDRANSIISDKSGQVSSALRKIYGYRNKALHGALEFPSLDFHADAGMVQWPFEESQMAQNLAISLLQQHYLRNTTYFCYDVVSVAT
jgi:hypothetical protein